MIGKWNSSTLTSLNKQLRMLVVLGMLFGMLAPLMQPRTAQAAQVTKVELKGGTGTYTAPNGTIYAKSGGALTLEVTTDDTTKCVELTGAYEAQQISSTEKTLWSFPLAAGTGEGTQTLRITATAYKQANPHGKCVANQNETLGTQTASYVYDNTGPVVTAQVAPAANDAGWHKSDVAITWSASDGTGSGVKTGPTPATDSVTADTAAVTKSSSATDQLGLSGSGSVTVKLDKTAPTITGSRSPDANAVGWNNSDVTVSFETSDALSGVASNPASKVLGEGANQSHTGTVTDNAGNSASATVSGINVDKTKPSLSGAPTNANLGTNGWYKGDVTVVWTAADTLSGLVAEPANSTISGEGTGLTASASVQDKAGNSTSATSSPAVRIDRTAPTTGISGVSNNWVNGNVTVSLSPVDALSDVASTSYAVDGGTPQTGTSFTLSTEGDHTVTFFSTDKAGNAEAAQTAHVKIDKTAPTIGHTFTPLTYTDGAWTNQDVTVTFECADQGGSGVASCTSPVTKTTEGEGQQVVGTATDNAANSATNTAVVSIDKTAPTITASADRAANGVGWYKDNVTVSFTASDALSGVATKSADKVLGEGANQSASGTATDAAGNSATASVSGINIDKTAPTLNGTPSVIGWARGDVTVKWAANDPLSGLAGAVPGDSTVTGEGDNLSASESVSDKAGNTTTETVSGIKIDRTAPSTSASVPDPVANGWYAGAVEVTLSTGTDLSGVDKTYYSVDGGETPQVYNGPFSHSLKGIHTITFWSVDKAGNVEDKTAAGHSITLKLDGTPPTTTISLPAAFATGWYADEVPVAFAANDAETGVAKTYYSVDGGDAQEYTGGFLHTLDGTHTITFWSVDSAGNVEDKTQAANTVEIKVDTSDPTITGSRTPAANSFGWNNTKVTVHFECKDSHSGVAIANCTPDTEVVNEGTGQSVSGTAKDNVGKTATTTVGDINIDKTKPTLSGAATTQPNAAGWYKGDVTIAWTGQDGLSDIDTTTQPANSTITGEGNNLGAGPVTIKDKAGNVSEPASVSGIKIDRTAPVVTGTPTSELAPVGGWYRTNVVVDFTCTDNLSGVASCPTSKALNGDGANQSVISDPATDLAGNASTGKTVGGINIDSKAPLTSAELQCTGKNGYCRGNKATVVLTAADQTGLSGVKEVRYSTNNGSSWTTVAGTTASVDINLAGNGKAKVLFYAVDNAGNTEAQGGVEVKYDTIAPTVTGTRNPAANSAGWNKSDVTVHFDAQDSSDGSGVDLSTVTPDQTISTETAGQVVTGEAYDLAGNKGTDSVTVKLDTTAPSITGAIVTGTQGNNGWYVGPVTVRFTCSDLLSGVAVCPEDVTLTTNGATQSITRSATDAADNTANATVSGINIDQEKPTITGVNVADQTYILGSVPAATCTATDTFSGLASCTVAVSGGNANGVGTFSYTATATDKAGNTQSATGSYRVIYNVQYGTAFFLQPINDTAHTTGLTTSIFKGGSTVPVKFQLKDANGNIVQPSSAPLWITPVKGTATTAPVDESVYSDPATSGSTYRWDATSQQYIYNWSTKGSTSGFYYRVGVKLDDGRTYAVNIGLR